MKAEELVCNFSHDFVSKHWDKINRDECDINETKNVMTNVKMFLFARWIATCYADSHLDNKTRCEHDEGFNISDAISVLNRETGYWYREKLKHFNDVVYPNYIKNGTVENTKEFLK